MAAQLRELTQNPPQDASERRELYEAARDLYMSLETPFDTMHRLLWSIQQLPLTQVGVDMRLFKTLAESPSKHWTTKDLSIATNVDGVLLYRVLRYLVSFGLVHEANDGKYSANESTKWLATPGAEGGVKHYLKNISPVSAALPEVLQRQKYQNPTNPTDTAFQVAHNTTSHAYSWAPSDPSVISAFLDFMKSQRASQRDWTEAFPMESLKLAQDEVDQGRAVFVDVGGASGHQCISLRKSHPELTGNVIVQDQERAIASADKSELEKHKVEAHVHDFFTEQPARAAKAYYMRNIMHDWPDDKCVEILRNLRTAMAEDSVILIDDTVLPDVGASWKQAQKDIQMMSVLAAIERSVSQWHALMEKAGLRVKAIHTYDQDMGDSIIEATLA